MIELEFTGDLSQVIYKKVRLDDLLNLLILNCMKQ